MKIEIIVIAIALPRLVAIEHLCHIAVLLQIRDAALEIDRALSERVRRAQQREKLSEQRMGSNQRDA